MRGGGGPSFKGKTSLAQLETRSACPSASCVEDSRFSGRHASDVNESRYFSYSCSSLRSMAHIRQSRLGSGLGLQVKALKIFYVVPSSLRSGAVGVPHRPSQISSTDAVLRSQCMELSAGGGLRGRIRSPPHAHPIQTLDPQPLHALEHRSPKPQHGLSSFTRADALAPPPAGSVPVSVRHPAMNRHW